MFDGTMIDKVLSNTMGIFIGLGLWLFDSLLGKNNSFADHKNDVLPFKMADVPESYVKLKVYQRCVYRHNGFYWGLHFNWGPPATLMIKTTMTYHDMVICWFRRSQEWEPLATGLRPF